MINEADLFAAKKLSKETAGRLFRYALPFKRSFLAAFLCLLVATIADVLGPILSKTFIDRYLTPAHFPTRPIVALAASYLLLQWISALFNYLQFVNFQKSSVRIIRQLRIDVFTRVQHLALAFFDRTPTGTLVSRITNDTEAVSDLFVSVLSTVIQNIFLLTGILISMFTLNSQLASYCLILIPVIVFIMWLYSRLSSKYFHLARQRLSILNAKLNESLQGMYIIQAMRQVQRLRQEFSDINQSYRSARMKNMRLNSIMLRPLVDILYFCTLMVVLFFFGVRSFHTTVDIGVIYAFVNYLERFFDPVNNMMQRLNLFQQAVVSAERVFQLLDVDEMEPEQIGSENPIIERGDIAFHDVSFSYDGKTEVLKHISFTAKRGQTVALVGHTGSGKSSIVNLLLRFYPVVSGHITIDGRPLDAFSDPELRREIGLVIQDPFLFVGDIEHNIRLGRPEVETTDIHTASAFVQAADFVESLPEGYASPVTERGATFSAGQRQLISFARTMATNPKILVLDEATASIDTETEEAIQEALARMRQGRTTIAIAHRLSTIQDADLILVLHHGEIVERGTHQELLAEQGLYHKMFLLQQGVKARA